MINNLIELIGFCRSLYAYCMSLCQMIFHIWMIRIFLYKSKEFNKYSLSDQNCAACERSLLKDKTDESLTELVNLKISGFCV